MTTKTQNYQETARSPIIPSYICKGQLGLQATNSGQIDLLSSILFHTNIDPVLSLCFDTRRIDGKTPIFLCILILISYFGKVICYIGTHQDFPAIRHFQLG